MGIGHGGKLSSNGVIKASNQEKATYEPVQKYPRWAQREGSMSKGA